MNISIITHSELKTWLFSEITYNQDVAKKSHSQSHSASRKLLFTKFSHCFCYLISQTLVTIGPDSIK
jgi:hypothetical protein